MECSSGGAAAIAASRGEKRPPPPDAHPPLLCARLGVCVCIAFLLNAQRSTQNCQTTSPHARTHRSGHSPAPAPRHLLSLPLSLSLRSLAAPRRVARPAPSRLLLRRRQIFSRRSHSRRRMPRADRNCSPALLHEIAVAKMGAGTTFIVGKRSFGSGRGGGGEAVAGGTGGREKKRRRMGGRARRGRLLQTGRDSLAYEAWGGVFSSKISRERAGGEGSRGAGNFGGRERDVGKGPETASPQFGRMKKREGGGGGQQACFPRGGGSRGRPSEGRHAGPPSSCVRGQGVWVVRRLERGERRARQKQRKR